jgi:hypothetical protein
VSVFPSSTSQVRSRSFLQTLCAIAFLVFNFQIASAQTFTSSITGKVNDPSGAAVPNAPVQLRNVATNDVHQTTSQADGSFQFININPGTYQVSIAMTGFKTAIKSNLILTADTAATVNIALELGETQQRVEVSTESLLVDTQTANTSVTMDSKLIEALTNNTRNPLNFVFAVAGTTQAPGGQTQTYGTLDQMSSNFGMNGGRTGDESILIDGAPSQAVDWGGLMVAPLQDSVQEQQIIENTYDAAYEKGGAGIVMLITKGGGNKFHGEAYDYLQNSALDANSWYNNQYGFAKSPFKQNQFGGNIGGPILKRYKLYFFGGYEGLRQPNTQTTLLTVPTQAERMGDFSQALNADGTPDLIYNPYTTNTLSSAAGTFTRSGFVGNVIPSSLINPVGQAIVNLYPLPNRPGTGPNDINNYAASGGGNTLNDKMDSRVDWDQSDKHRIFFRFSDRFRQDQVVPCFFCNGADTGNNQYNNGFQAVINDTITPDPTWVINTYIAYSRWKEQHIAQGYGIASASTIGLSDSLFQAPVLPTIYPDGPYTSLGNGSFEKYARDSDTAQINLTKIIGKHTLKFGFNFDDQVINSVSQSVGSFNFSSALTSCDPTAGSPCTSLNYTSTESGNAIASMLLGTASGGGQGINIDPAMSLHSYGTYIQDQWRVNSRLTINAGLRYENQRPATERYNRLEYFNLNVPNPIGTQVSPLYNETINQVFGRTLTGGFEYAGTNGNGRYAWPPDNLNFAPRLGIAYKVTNKLVARIGGGIFFLAPSAMISFDNPGEFYGFSSSTSYISTVNNGYTPLNPISNPFPQGITQPQGSSQGLLTLVGNGLGQIWPDTSHPTGYSEQWSFDLQYQLTNRSVFQIGYKGNAGRKLLYGNPNLDADQLPDQYLSLGTQLDAQVNNPFYGVAPSNTYLGSAPTIAYNELLRPYPQFTYLQWTRSLPGARSSFNALNAKYNYRFQTGLTMLLTYQWSKALDNGPEDNFGWATGNQWRDAYNTKLDYDISTHDVPQSFVASLVYDLPYGRGQRWGSSAPAVVKEVLGNWQVSTVTTLQSGLPLYGLEESPSNQLNDYGYPGPQLPDIVNYNMTPSNQSPTNWVNASSFAAPTSAYALGNAAQRITQLRDRAERNVDLSVAKNFGTEQYQVWLRGEFLNLFNYAQYNNICLDLSYSTCTFGTAYGTQNQPRTIQLSLKFTF